LNKQTDDLELVRRVQQGEREAFRPLVDRHSRLVFQIVNKYVDRDDDAEELAQQIFVKAYERIDSFDERSKFSTWLYTLARNHCLDYAKNIRRQNQTFSQMDESSVDALTRDHRQPDDDLERKQWAELLQRGLDAIKQEYAEAFVMKYRDQMSYQAMATQLDVSVSALKVRVHRAKKQLRAFMDNHG
jgi:RNA polymerase sigma-70 factor (ECF subfamily)